MLKYFNSNAKCIAQTVFQVTEHNKAYKDNFQETFNFLHRNTQ